MSWPPCNFSHVLTYTFSKTNGNLRQVLKNGQKIPLNNGPVFVSSDKTLKEVVYDSNDKGVFVEVRFENTDHFRWTVDKSGFLNLQVAYEPKNNCLFAGITFDFPEENVAGMTWLGNGPYRVYKNRMKGVNFGLWEKAYNKTITGESGFVYPEFKGYHANTYWAEIQGKNQPGFRVYVQSEDIFLRMLTPDDPTAPAKTKIEYPKGDISFLHGINPIGTKFKDAERLGPQSSKYSFNRAKIHGGKLNIELTFEF